MKKLQKILILLIGFVATGLTAQNSIQIDVDLNIPRSFSSEIEDRIAQWYTLQTVAYSQNDVTKGSLTTITDSSTKGKTQIVPIKVSYKRDLGAGIFSIGYRISNYSYTGDYTGLNLLNFNMGMFGQIQLNGFISGTIGSIDVKEKDIELGYALKLLEALELEIILGNRTHDRSIATNDFGLASGSQSSIELSKTTLNNFNYSLNAKGLYYGFNLTYNLNPEWGILLGYKTANLSGDTEYNSFQNNDFTISLISPVPMKIKETLTNIENGLGWSGTVKVNEILLGGIYKVSDNGKIRFGIQQLTTKVAYSDSPVTFLILSSGNSTNSGLNIDFDKFGNVGKQSVLLNIANTNTHEDKRTAIFIGYSHNINL